MTEVVNLVAYLRLVRPKQWTKNLLVFAALIFTKRFLDPDSVLLTLWAFVALSLVSSAVYVLNDLLDAESDREHPVKRFRPIASGQVARWQAWVLGAVCFLAGLAVSAAISVWFLSGIGWYLLLQLLYNLLFKHHPVVDVAAISLGFVIRAAVGAIALETDISGWLLLCTGALALLLASAKRRHEFILQGDNRGNSRKVLVHYTQPSLDAMVMFSAAVAALTFGVYAIESPTARHYPGLVVTVPFVVFGILRYLFLVFAKERGGEPENLVFEPQMLLTIVGFLVAALWAMTGQRLPHIN